ncbi:metallophosphoesterase family protein [Paraburkholderia sp.]|uniref:metallophosphoesterase family protein n=1 Tax=Paraburkholderia sp. TaxID=1926495 RepID=UPI003C7C2EAF
MKDTKLAWLHLSDLHFGHPTRSWDSVKVLEELHEAIEPAVKTAGVTPTFLFFTGDLAFGQKGGEAKILAKQLSDGADFLEKICSIVDPPIRNENVFIVPGNHDLNRGYISGMTEVMHKSLDLSKTQEMIREAGRDWRFFTQRQDDFRDLIVSRFPHLGADSTRLCYAVNRKIEDLSIGIIGLNSSWSCGRDGEKGSLWMAGRFQAEISLPTVAKADLKFLLSHHPPGWFGEAEELSFWRSVPQVEFDVFLHGHEHLQWIQASQDGFVTIAAGAAYEESHRPTGFNLTVYDPSKRAGWSHLRSYDSKGRGWMPENVFGRTDGSGNWPIEHFGRKRRSTEDLRTLIDRLKGTSASVMISPSDSTDATRPEQTASVPVANVGLNRMNVVTELTKVLYQSDSADSLLRSLAANYGVSLEEIQFQTLNIALGIPVELTPNRPIHIAVVRALSLDCSPHDTDAVGDAPDPGAITVKGMCPGAQITNFTLEAKDGVTNSYEIVRVFAEIARYPDIDIIIYPYVSDRDDMGIRTALADLATSLGILVVASENFQPIVPEDPAVTPFAIRVAAHSANIRAGVIPFPSMNNMPLLSVAAGFVACILKAVGWQRTPATANSIVRGLYWDVRERGGIPNLERILDWIRLSSSGGEAGYQDVP